MLCSRFDDPDVGLVRNEKIDIGARESCRIECTIGRFGHRPDGVLEHFAACHLYEVTALLENLRAHWNLCSTTGPIQQICELPVAAQERRENSLASSRALQNDR